MSVGLVASGERWATHSLCWACSTDAMSARTPAHR